MLSLRLKVIRQHRKSMTSNKNDVIPTNMCIDKMNVRKTSQHNVINILGIH